MRSSIVSFIFALLAVFATFAAAAPLLQERDVFVPPVLAPGKNAVWPKGTTQTVKWDVSKPPAQITNGKGTIVLRDVKRGVLLLDRKPLAEGFDILLGEKQVVVPTDLPAGKYQCVVFGNSGNWGPVFEIVDAVSRSNKVTESVETPSS